VADEITVTLEDNEPDVVVVVENQSPDVSVNVSEVGLVGPPGPPGPQGPAGVDTALALNEHIMDENPHPVYDSGIDWLVLYENAKV